MEDRCRTGETIYLDKAGNVIDPAGTPTGQSDSMNDNKEVTDDDRSENADSSGY